MNHPATARDAIQGGGKPAHAMAFLRVGHQHRARIDRQQGLVELRRLLGRGAAIQRAADIQRRREFFTHMQHRAALEIASRQVAHVVREQTRHEPGEYWTEVAR